MKTLFTLDEILPGLMPPIIALQHREVLGCIKGQVVFDCRSATRRVISKIGRNHIVGTFLELTLLNSSRYHVTNNPYRPFLVGGIAMKANRIKPVLDDVVAQTGCRYVMAAANFVAATNEAPAFEPFMQKLSVTGSDLSVYGESVYSLADAAQKAIDNYQKFLEQKVRQGEICTDCEAGDYRHARRGKSGQKLKDRDESWTCCEYACGFDWKADNGQHPATAQSR